MKCAFVEPPFKQNLKLKEKSEIITTVTHASQRIPSNQTPSNIKYLNLDYFKFYPCPNPKPHLHKQCVYYHNQKDHKRFGDFYNDIMCKTILNGCECPSGQQCKNAHSRVQQLYQYQSYKKKFCSHYPNNIQKCEYGDFCSFAHCEEQIRVNLIHNYQYDADFYMFHYKTQFCPFNLTEHDKSKCVYAHNLQDYRRSPSCYNYTPNTCFNWNLKDMIYNYDSGCDKGVNCQMCHGWKQLQYHPNFYCTTQCTVTNCNKGQCPNYHSEQQKRIVPFEFLNNIFKYVPRNRIVRGTFKEVEDQKQFIPRLDEKIIRSSNTIPYQKDHFSSEQKVESKSEVVSFQNEFDRQQEKDEYHKYLLDQEEVESQNEEDWSETDNYEVVGHVEKLIIDQ